MTTVRIKLSFDIASKEETITVFAKQWDNLTRRLLISLVQNGKTFEPHPQGMIFLRGKKMDGTVFYITGNPTENKGEYEFLLSKNALSASGLIRCDVAYSYTDGEETPVCSTNGFIIDNLSAVCSPDDYEETNGFESIEEFLARANEALGKFDDYMDDMEDILKSDTEIYVKRSGMNILEIPDISSNNNRVKLQVSQFDFGTKAAIGVPGNNVYGFNNSFSGYMDGLEYAWDGNCELSFVGTASDAGDAVIYEGGSYPFSDKDVIFGVCGNAEGMEIEISAAGGFSAVVNPNETVKIPKGTIISGSEWGITIKCTEARRYNGEKLYLMFNYGAYPTVMYHTDDKGELLFPCKPNTTLVCPDREMTAIYQCNTLEIPHTSEAIVASNIPKVESSKRKIILHPNKFYLFPEMSSLDIQLGGIIDDSIVQEYKFRFISGATPTILALPETVKGDIEVEANSVIEISIIDNYAVSQSWAVG